MREEAPKSAKHEAPDATETSDAEVRHALDTAGLERPQVLEDWERAQFRELDSLVRFNPLDTRTIVQHCLTVGEKLKELKQNHLAVKWFEQAQEFADSEQDADLRGWAESLIAQLKKEAN